MEMIVKEYMVDKTMIGFIKFIFEAYEGVAVSSTLDAKSGHIRLAIAPERLNTAQKIIADLKKDFSFNEV